MRWRGQVVMTSGCVIAVSIIAAMLYGFPFHALYSNDIHAGITTLFPPDDRPLDHLTPLIENETSRIYVAAYRLTDDEVAGALIRALDRGIPIEVIADASALEARYNKILEMLTYGMDVYVFPPFSQTDDTCENRISKNALMHNKFMLFERARTVWTGSFNFTMAARNTNQENIVVMRDRKQFMRYKDHFNLLKRRSTPLARLLRAAV